MPWTNYHSHTHFCDGSDKPEDYIIKAIKQGLKAYGYSGHAPVGFDTDWTIPDNKIEEYISLVKAIKKKYSDKIETYLGLEIDYIPGETGKNKHIFKNLDLDYFISSIHYVDTFENGEHWNIDHCFEVFEKGLTGVFGGDFKQASKRFYEVSIQMVKEDKPDVIGHLDKIKMYNNTGNYFSEDEKWYRKQVEELLEVVKQTGTIVEINTRGYYRYGQLDLYPSQWIIGKMAAMGIPMMLNSDCHNPQEIISGFDYAVPQLKKAGVKRLWALVENEWQGFEYNENGLVI